MIDLMFDVDWNSICDGLSSLVFSHFEKILVLL